MIDLIIKILVVILLAIIIAVFIQLLSILLQIKKRLDLVFKVFRVVVDLGDITSQFKHYINTDNGRLFLTLTGLIAKKFIKKNKRK